MIVKYNLLYTRIIIYIGTTYYKNVKKIYKSIDNMFL